MIIFGSGEHYSPKKDGKTVAEKCPHCEKHVSFYEVEKVEYISLFFIPVLDAKKDTKLPPNKHQMKCPNCENVFVFSDMKNAKTSQNTENNDNTVWGNLKKTYNFFTKKPQDNQKQETPKNSGNQQNNQQYKQDTTAKSYVEQLKERNEKIQQNVESDLERLKREMNNKK